MRARFNLLLAKEAPKVPRFRLFWYGSARKTTFGPGTPSNITRLTQCWSCRQVTCILFAATSGFLRESKTPGLGRSRETNVRNEMSRL